LDWSLQPGDEFDAGDKITIYAKGIPSYEYLNGILGSDHTVWFRIPLRDWSDLEAMEVDISHDGISASRNLLFPLRIDPRLFLYVLYAFELLV
jgi:hypothetical protein